MPCLINNQILKMISLVESFLWSDKQGTPEEGQRIQQPNHVSTNNNKDVDNSPKNHTQNIALFFWFGLVSLFNGISTFVGYLMPTLFS